MVAPHVSIPPITIDAPVSVTRDGFGTPYIEVQGRQAIGPTRHLQLSVEGAKRLIGDLKAAIARAETIS